MAARAIIRKVNLKSQAFPTIRTFVSTGIDKIVSTGIDKTTIKLLVPKNVTKTTKEWKIQNFEQVVQTGMKLLQNVQMEGVEEEKMRDSNSIMNDALKTIYQLWIKKIEEEQRILLQQGWTCLRDVLRAEGLETCHQRLLFSIKPIEPYQAAFIKPIEGVIEFAKASPETGLTSLRRLPLPHPGPYQLPRQVVKGMVCITTKNAFLLHKITTGVNSRWIETTTTGDLCRGKPRRQVVSIALGYAPESLEHKVVCISTDVKTRFAPEITEAKTYGFLVVEVLTVRESVWIPGEHNWRRLEADGLPPAFQLGERFTIVDGPIYFDGQIHWHMHYDRRCPYILVFRVDNETFEYIPIPTVLVRELVDSLQHVLSRLMEVDGKIAILKSTSGQETSSLHICHRSSKCTKINWTEENILIPYAHVRSASSIEALTETDFIFLKSRRLILYYNKKTKASLTLRLPSLRIRDHFDWGRIVQL